MDTVRLGVIGCGGMAQNHMNALASVQRVKFAAASDTFEANLQKTVDKFSVKGFADGIAMMDSGLVDAVLIATPHPFHPLYAKAALERGLHVLTEKPVSVTAKSAQEVNDLALANPRLKYAVMYQFRTVPKWRKAKQLIEEGRIGRIQRILWVVTTWFRTQAYYDSGSWRATWEGEGGGVLLNQCPHNLDVLTWLTGMPTRVTARLGFGKYHKIEVEDEVTAFLEYANGATGTFITTTGEAPGSDYFEIVGDHGKLVITPGEVLEFTQIEGSVSNVRETSKSAWPRMESSKHSISCGQGGGHQEVMQNFINAILDNTPLVAPGVEGLYSVELANAMIMSGVTQQPVSVPTDRDGYEQLLNDLIAKSDRSRKPVTVK